MDRYKEFRQIMLDGGVPTEEVERVIANCVREDHSLDMRICPDCGSSLSRNADVRQVGATELSGTWYNYRCHCGYMADRKE